MGRVFVQHLSFGEESVVGTEFSEGGDEDDSNEDAALFVCKGCGAHAARGSDLISKNFRGRSGKAFLFNSCVNTVNGESEDRELATGWHTVADIMCIRCGKSLGWKYFHAFRESERYKVGKSILEKAYVKRVRGARKVLEEPEHEQAME